MKLENLFLKKEELPILHDFCFRIPIHPKLLNPNIEIDKSIAQKIFPQIAEEWYDDLNEYAKLEKNKSKKEWYQKVFLRERPKIEWKYSNQIFGGWEDRIGFMENGLVRDFMINRNAGGSLYFNQDDFNCEGLIPDYLVKFSKEKSTEFEFRKVENFSIAHFYSQHNIDSFPGALFLRNWVIKYMNEVFKQIFLK